MIVRVTTTLMVLLVLCAGCATRGVNHAEHLAQGKRLCAGKDYANAMLALRNVTEDKMCAVELRAEALYWMAESYAAQGNLSQAYRTAKRLIWDYPETMWAGRYMGRLPIWPDGETQQSDREASSETARGAASGASHP